MTYKILCKVEAAILALPTSISVRKIHNGVPENPLYMLRYRTVGKDVALASGNGVVLFENDPEISGHFRQHGVSEIYRC